jgi:hypothetical protein
MADQAETGMALIEREAVNLVAPGEHELKSTYDELKKLHGAAHDWEPPGLASIDRTLQRPIRSYIRRWIAEWDLRRLYPRSAVELVEETLGFNYSEDADLETPTEENNES